MRLFDIHIGVQWKQIVAWDQWDQWDQGEQENKSICLSLAWHGLVLIIMNDLNKCTLNILLIILLNY